MDELFIYVLYVMSDEKIIIIFKLMIIYLFLTT